MLEKEQWEKWLKQEGVSLVMEDQNNTKPLQSSCNAE